MTEPYPYYPAPPVSPAPPMLPTLPHAQPQPYHLMLRTWTYEWWKPVVGIVLAMTGMLVVAPVALLPVLAAGVALQSGPFWQNFVDAATLKAVTPAALFYLNLVLASMIPLTWFIMSVLHRMRTRWLASVVTRIRRRIFLILLILAVITLIL